MKRLLNIGTTRKDISLLARQHKSPSYPRIRLSRPSIKEILRDHQQDNIRITGWVRTKRRSKTMLFMEVTDGSSNRGMQCVYDLTSADKSPEVIRQLQDVGVGANISIDGKLVSSPGAGQSLELQIINLRMNGQCDQQAYPMQKKRHSFEFMREWTHLRQRSRLFHAVTAIRHELTMFTHDFFARQNGFTHIHTPIITANDCEGGGEVFEVQPPVSAATANNSHDKKNPEEFFGHPAYLTVSSQLHLEMFAQSLGRVYTLSPCFRADMGSDVSTRHLAEFYMLEAEWCQDSEKSGSGVHELCDVAEHFLRQSIQNTLTECSEELEYLSKEVPLMQQLNRYNHHQNDDSSKSLIERLSNLADRPFLRISYTDAYKILTEAQQRHIKRDLFQFPLLRWGQSLQTEHEKFLCNFLENSAVFVVDYPAECKPFYMRSNHTSNITEEGHEAMGETVACMDLLVPGIGELVGGSMREERLDNLTCRMKQMLPAAGIDTLNWYLDLRRFGSATHGGFGIGFDRLLMMLTAMPNIRDVASIGRWKSKCQY